MTKQEMRAAVKAKRAKIPPEEKEQLAALLWKVKVSAREWMEEA